MSIRRRVNAVVLPALAAAGSGLLSGCYAEGGPWGSDDAYAVVSREWEPKTITLKDTRTGQDFWSIDVPVGKKLLFEFDDEGGSKNGYTPSLMSWGLVDADYDLGMPDLKNTLAVPPATARRIDMTLRTAPEFPDSMIAATKGAVSPAKPVLVREPTVTVPRPTAGEVELPSGGMPPALRPAGETPVQPGMVVPPPPLTPRTPAAPAPTPAPAPAEPAPVAPAEPAIDLPG